MDVGEFKNKLWEYTRNISDHTHVVITSFCNQFGLTIVQVRILKEIANTDTHTIGSLAEKLQMAGTNLSTMCKKLEQQGLVSRRRDPKDERVVKVLLTEEGIDTVLEIDQILMEKLSQYMIDESPEIISDIMNGLEKVNQLLEKIRKIENI